MATPKRGIIMKRNDGSEVVNYNIDSFPTYIHDGYIFPGCTWERVPHYHDDVEFISVYSGSMGYSVDGVNLTLKKGDTLFVNADTIHYSFSTENRVTRYYLAVMHPRIICSSFAVESKAIKPVISDRSVPFIHFKSEDFDAAAVQQTLKTLTKEEENKSEFLITKGFFELWDIIMHRFTDAYRLHVRHIEDGDSHNSKLKAMMIFIDQHYNEQITLKDIAEAGCVSQSLCNQIFNKLTEKSPVEYLMHYRSRKVADLLQAGNMSMSEIAEITGFTGASYMAETFKKFYKMSPREFRKSSRPGTSSSSRLSDYNPKAEVLSQCD